MHRLPFLILFGWMATSRLMGQSFEPLEPIRFLALGDSYTYGQGVDRNQIWPAQFQDSLRAYGYDFEKTDIIAVTGWRTDQLLTAMDNAGSLEGYNLVSLLIGVNNQYQRLPFERYAPEFTELLERAIRIAGAKERVFVLSIPDYSYTPFAQYSDTASISREIDEYNLASQDIAWERGVRYYYITDISRQGLIDPGLVAGDGLHPSAKQYTRWVERMLVHWPRRAITSGGASPRMEAFQEFRLHPNPARDKIRIEYRETETSPGTGRIMNVSGRVIYTFPLLEGNRTALQIGELQPGIYIIQLSSGKGNCHLKFIKR